MAAHEHHEDHRARRLVTCVRYGAHVTLGVIAVNLAAHTGWYSFEHLLHVVGAPGPKALASVAGGLAGLPVVVGVLVAAHRLEERERDALHHEHNHAHTRTEEA